MNEYILNQSQIKDLMNYLVKQMPHPDCCDGTLRHTKKWIKDNISVEKRDAVIEEIENGGGYCDCEVVFNCYQD